MRDADAELKALAKQGIKLDVATEQAYRAVLDAEALTAEAAQNMVRVLKTPGLSAQDGQEWQLGMPPQSKSLKRSNHRT